MVKLTIPGAPVGKGRPRHTATGRTYTPEKTRAYERMIRMAYQTAAAGVKAGPTCYPEGPVLVTLAAYYPIPKSARKSDREAMEAGKIVPMKKPDIDNVAKVVLDGLNGAAYKDDAQVASVVASKYYSNDPRVVVIVCGRDEYGFGEECV